MKVDRRISLIFYHWQNITSITSKLLRQLYIKMTEFISTNHDSCYCCLADLREDTLNAMYLAQLKL